VSQISRPSRVGAVIGTGGHSQRSARDSVPHFPSLMIAKRKAYASIRTHDFKAHIYTQAKKSRSLFIVADLLWARESSTTRCAIRCDFYSIGAFCCDLTSNTACHIGEEMCVRK
jgi:hypothetical protein